MAIRIANWVAFFINIKGITVLIDEYKRLKTKNINENLS